MGIDFHLNCEIGRDITFSDLTSEYDAVFIGVGTYGMMRADLPHEDAPGVIQALPFLTAHTRQRMGLPESEEYPLTDVEGKRVVVLGGGDTTMDCLRTSIRLNAASGPARIVVMKSVCRARAKRWSMRARKVSSFSSMFNRNISLVTKMGV